MLENPYKGECYEDHHADYRRSRKSKRSPVARADSLWDDLRKDKDCEREYCREYSYKRVSIHFIHEGTYY